ncbi:jg5793 [Pararge aegeria aegeria]|uniref:Jg5793 protein n=1 Tax=Pararge aegeria aegeria TaxID=348720 RepID=A0A8S4R4Q8_9NEOP|nr:jg5793 [Pararge aegeria aegeria]
MSDSYRLKPHGFPTLTLVTGSASCSHRGSPSSETTSISLSTIEGTPGTQRFQLEDLSPMGQIESTFPSPGGLSLGADDGRASDVYARYFCGGLDESTSSSLNRSASYFCHHVLAKDHCFPPFPTRLVATRSREGVTQTHSIAHADYGPCEHLHGIALALDRPITGRPLPRELLQSPPPARQLGGTNGDIDDSRPIGINNIPARADNDFADSDADISRTRQTNRPKANDGGP